MPRYVYRCTSCEELLVLFHLSNEVATECTKCRAPDGLIKVLTPFTTTRGTPSATQKVGETTEEFIKQSREELGRQKKDRMDKVKK